MSTGSRRPEAFREPRVDTRRAGVERRIRLPERLSRCATSRSWPWRTTLGPLRTSPSSSSWSI